MKTELFPRLVLVLVMCLLVWECAEPQRSYPVRDYLMSIPPSIKETKSLGTSWENDPERSAGLMSPIAVMICWNTRRTIGRYV